MESVIEKIWENEMDMRLATETEQRLLHELTTQLKALEKSLNAEQRAQLTRFDEIWNEYASACEQEMFTRAFRLGMQLGMEVLTDLNE